MLVFVIAATSVATRVRLNEYCGEIEKRLAASSSFVVGLCWTQRPIQIFQMTESGSVIVSLLCQRFTSFL